MPTIIVRVPIIPVIINVELPGAGGGLTGGRVIMGVGIAVGITVIIGVGVTSIVGVGVGVEIIVGTTVGV